MKHLSSRTIAWLEWGVHTLTPLIGQQVWCSSLAHIPGIAVVHILMVLMRDLLACRLRGRKKIDDLLAINATSAVSKNLTAHTMEQCIISIETWR